MERTNSEIQTAWRWPFQVGDRVHSTDEWGPLICSLSIRAKTHPHAEYTVTETSMGGRWLKLEDDEGLEYGLNRGFGDVSPAYGHGYFRIVGDCGEHCPEYRSLPAGWFCARCDEPTGVRA